MGADGDGGGMLTTLAMVGGIMLSLLGLSAGKVSTLSVPTLPPLNREDFVIVLARELAKTLSLLVRFDVCVGAARD